VPQPPEPSERQHLAPLKGGLASSGNGGSPDRLSSLAPHHPLGPLGHPSPSHIHRPTRLQEIDALDGETLFADQLDDISAGVGLTEAVETLLQATLDMRPAPEAARAEGAQGAGQAPLQQSQTSPQQIKEALALVHRTFDKMAPLRQTDDLAELKRELAKERQERQQEHRENDALRQDVQQLQQKLSHAPPIELAPAMDITDQFRIGVHTDKVPMLVSRDSVGVIPPPPSLEELSDVEDSEDPARAVPVAVAEPVPQSLTRSPELYAVSS